LKRFLTLIAVMGLAVGVMLIPAAALAAFGIDPGKVYVDNLYPGAEADYKITIYNQNDYEATFAITARDPDYTATDYEVFPYPEWITVTPDQATIKPGGQSDVLIVLIMPEDASYSGKKGETWISFKEQGTEGMIKIELCSRLFISTRVEKAGEPPAVSGDGAVGITAEAEEPEPGPSFPWVIPGAVLGALIAGGAVFFLVRRRQQV